MLLIFLLYVVQSRGNPKSINFKINNPRFEKKIRHIIIEEQFPNLKDG